MVAVSDTFLKRKPVKGEQNLVEYNLNTFCIKGKKIIFLKAYFMNMQAIVSQILPHKLLFDKFIRKFNLHHYDSTRY